MTGVKQGEEPYLDKVKHLRTRGKGSSSCHIPNLAYREKYSKIRKSCGCFMGESCECHVMDNKKKKDNV